MTNFTAPLYVSGAPVLPGAGGIPFTGNYWFVNELTGSDGNPGAANAPLASLAQAQINAVANNGDVVVLLGSCHVTATLNWAKNGVHLIGMGAPSNNNRARISPKAGLSQGQVTALHPLVNVTAQGCIFANISAFYGFDGVLTPPAASICWQEKGGRNSYINDQFLGFGDALMSVLAGARAFVFGTGGAGEDYFSDCMFGADTEVRGTAANATLEFIAAAGSPRNVFKDCLFTMDSALATNNHVLVSAGGMDRYADFDRCAFHTFGTTLNAAVVNSGGSPGGNVLLKDVFSVGSTALATTGNVYVTGNIPTATTSGIAVLAT